MGARLTLAQLAPADGAGFDQPFELLAACHDKLQRMLVLLERLGPHLRERGADPSAQQAAADVLRYFDLAAPQHHRDEELHLFPLLDACGDAATVRLVARLLRDHLLLQSRWDALRPALEQVVSGSLQRFTATQEVDLTALASFYREHLHAEDRIAYPAAQRLMPSQARPAMGAEMQQRRTLASGKKTPGTRPGE